MILLHQSVGDWYCLYALIVEVVVESNMVTARTVFFCTVVPIALILSIIPSYHALYLSERLWSPNMQASMRTLLMQCSPWQVTMMNEMSSATPDLSASSQRYMVDIPPDHIMTVSTVPALYICSRDCTSSF